MWDTLALSSSILLSATSQYRQRLPAVKGAVFLVSAAGRGYECLFMEGAHSCTGSYYRDIVVII